MQQRLMAPPSAKSVLESYRLTPDLLERVAALGREADVQPEALVTAFYRWLDDQPWKTAFFDGGVPDRVRSAQVGYWREFLRGVVDDPYVASRISVGATHARIGLPPKAYTAAMAFSQRWLNRSLRATGWPDEVLLETSIAISALCQLDAALVMDAYAAHSNRLLHTEADTLTRIHEELTRVVIAASEGSFAERYRALGDRDAELGRAVNTMVESFEGTIRQLEAVAAGDYSTSVAPRSDRDELGHVLAEMTTKLREATERARRDQWLKQGQADVFERMRGELPTSELSDAVLCYVAGRLDAPVGCVYAWSADDDLELVATFGIPADRLPARVALGDGVLGEAARHHEPVPDLDISHAPLRTFHGLGEITLDHVALLPLVSSGQLRGMLQLATPKALDELSWEFLTQIAENVAIGLAGASSRFAMSGLLTESQRQREELQTQAEELRVTNEELAERSHALQQAREDVQQQNVELQRKHADLEHSRLELEERARELALASRYKSQFLANMSHELRTPLNSMLLLTDSLVANPQGNLSERQLESLDVIAGGGRDLLRIINDILDLSKVEAGRLTLEVEAVPVAAILDSLERQFAPQAAQSGVTLTMTVDPDASTSIDTDPKRCAQVLKNLLSNALKFTSEGSVTLRATPATGDPRLRGDLRRRPVVALSVADTGIGIPEDKQALIFEAFQQADGSTSRRYGGTGLGLTVSRQLATLLGGQLHLASEPGRGSTFTLFLPLSAPRTSEQVDTPAPAPASPGPEPPSAPRPRVPEVLIVEDDPTFASILEGLVRERGYAPIVAHTGREALVLAERRAPQGIVLDLGLPDIDGMEVLDRLKRNLETRHIPVHVISAHACRLDTLQLGAVGFAQKPIGHDQLDEVLGRFERLWHRKSGRILVVEDDEASQHAIRALLQARDVAIVVAPTGTRGLELLDEDEFDCLVVDLGLPDMRGEDFLGRLNADHPPVIVYTAEDLSDAQLLALADHTSQVVVKGARSPERLLDEVSLFLHQVEADLPEGPRHTLQRLHGRDAALTGRRVLVVDDDMRNLFAMTELLQRHGVEVIKAKNGQVALDTLDRDPSIDLVVMDVMMPVMDGLEAMRRIRAEPGFAHLPIVAVTAKTLPEDRQACLEAGASDYIAKPMDPDNLLALMRVLLFDRQPLPTGPADAPDPDAGTADAC